ncbi:diacylglycerol/lipid kinase family protein [Algoriphagus winogradskyi]|uniref:Diacylglycerol kinase family enzyme n=1 Tax=Algoriphagus winogradskyi TaxID=237017 RepID=A0ABY1P125_9BACT|nr:diacylglycerol kinase family protein [Algoriphagus winogradskyi]SMP22948.1 Diacylglycerol kinase family enzyme [Algoriphagus winogradskyi]
MKIILIYNPTAGNEDFPLTKIIKSLEKQGASIVAQNCKEENYQKVFELSYDLIMIAGGDGTVEKILLDLRDIKYPIAILPFGNANNIAGSLDLTDYYKKIVDQYEKNDFQYLSIGKYKTKEDKGWFVEGIGWGIFAALLLQLDRDKNLECEQDSKVDFGIKNLIKLETKLPAHTYKIKLDKKDYSGEYVWMEIMNTKQLGPQLELAPLADHSDDFLDVMLVKENQKDELKAFLKAQKKGKVPSPFKTIKAKKIKISTYLPFHVDDELFEHRTLYEETPTVKISLTKHQLKILRNDKS